MKFSIIGFLILLLNLKSELPDRYFSNADHLNIEGCKNSQ